MERIKLDLTGGGFPFFNNGKELERGGKVAGLGRWDVFEHRQFANECCGDRGRAPCWHAYRRRVRLLCVR